MKLQLLKRIGEAENNEGHNDPSSVEANNEVIHMSDDDQQELPTTKKMKSGMDILLGEEEDTTIAAKTPLDEVLQLMEEKPIPRKVSPLVWWKKNSPKYPRLSSIARYILTIPAHLREFSLQLG